MKLSVKKRWLLVASHMVAYDPINNERYCKESFALSLIESDVKVLELINEILSIDGLDDDVQSAIFIETFDIKFLQYYRSLILN